MDDRFDVEAGREDSEHTAPSPSAELSQRARAIRAKMAAESDRLDAELREWEESVGIRDPSEDRDPASERAETTFDEMMNPAQRRRRRQLMAGCGVRLHQESRYRWWQFWTNPRAAKAVMFGTGVGIGVACLEVAPHTAWAIYGCGGGLVILGAGGYRLFWSRARHRVNKSYPGLADVSGRSSSPDGLHLWQHLAGPVMPAWAAISSWLFAAFFLGGVAVLVVGSVVLFR